MSTRASRQRPALQRRIRRFYDLLNRRDFESCHGMIDPCIRDNAGSVTLFQYGNALAQFLDHFGPLQVVKVEVTLHLNEPSVLYEGRDFAVGKTVLVDRSGEQRTLSERWVRQDAEWYTRSTGLIVPETSAR